MHASTQGRFPAGVRRLLTSSLCILSTSQPMRFESQPCGEVTNWAVSITGAAPFTLLPAPAFNCLSISQTLH